MYVRPEISARTAASFCEAKILEIYKKICMKGKINDLCKYNRVILNHLRQYCKFGKAMNAKANSRKIAQFIHKNRVTHKPAVQAADTQTLHR